jgi:hypothetical protein
MLVGFLKLYDLGKERISDLESKKKLPFSYTLN